MSYTYPGDRVKTELTFGSFPNDANHNAIVGMSANRMQSKDATGSPVYSPTSNISDSTGQVLTVPANAVYFTINSSVSCLVGEDSTFTYGFEIPASTVTTFDVFRQQYIYLLPTNSTNTVWFYFSTI